MKSLRDNIFTGFVILILVSVVSSFDCPEDCECNSLDVGKQMNHVKCTSINGLIGEERNTPIHSLDLSHANLNRISHSLEKLRDLTSLDLSHNNLSDIGRLGKRIKTLKLNHNKITSGKLTKMPHHLQNLDLSFNEITYLPLEITKLKSLKKIELTGNTINCTCQTLEVREWMQGNNIWTDNIKCAYPAEIKGQSWLQVKKSEICRKDDSITKISEHSRNENENDLMLGDQPIINEGSGDADVDELGKTFLPINSGDNKKLERMIMDDNEDGSGDDEIVDHAHLVTKIPQQDENDDQTNDDYEGSGSGGGPFAIPSSTLLDELIVSTTTTGDVYSEEDIFGAGLGIMTSRNDSSTTTELVPETTTDELIVPVVHFKDAAVPVSPKITPFEEEEQKELDNENNEGQEHKEEQQHEELDEKVPDDVVHASNSNNKIEDNNEELKEAGADESNSSYILLGIVLVIVIALIVFVAVKRTRAKRRSKRQEDPESPRTTELQDMDNKNVGKPIHKNGNAEHAPLIADRNKSDLAKPINGSKKVPYVPHEEQDGKAQEPLLKNKDEPDSNNYNKIPEAQPESNNNLPVKQNTPAEKDAVPKPAVRQSLDKSPQEPRKGGYPPPKSPRTKKPSTGDDEVFHPSSPKASSRYSPVYSPETGRVKIKLTETPKPKTPLLVTRSKSNAGDIITTPTDNNQTMPDNQ